MIKSIEVLELKPAFSKQVLQNLYKRYGLSAFSDFFYPKEDKDKIQAIKDWLSDNAFIRLIKESHIWFFLGVVYQFYVIVAFWLSIFHSSTFGIVMTAFCQLAAIGMFHLPLYILYKQIKRELTNPFTLISSKDHVEPYYFKLKLMNDNRQIIYTEGYAGITKDGKVKGLDFSGYIIHKHDDRQLVKKALSRAFRSKFLYSQVCITL